MKKVIYSSSFIEFLRNSDCKVATFLYRLHRKQYSPNLLTIDEVNFLTFRKDGTISYLPAGKELKYNDNGDWAKDGRQNGKPSKVIRKIFTKRALSMFKFKDADFECFTNAYKANFNDDGYTFELLSHSEIPNVYDMDRGIGEGSINNSCMNGDTEYLDIYKNCSKLQILILKDSSGLLCGRSLVWKIDDNITFMDRVYITQDFMYDMFISYAKKTGFWHKQDYRSYDNKRTFIMPCGNESTNTFIIYTDTDHDYYPYIDTFQYGGDGYLTNEDNSTYTYNNTDGSRDGEEDDHEGQCYDEINDEWIDEDESCYIENGERQYRHRTTHIDNCICVGDDWYHQDDCNICEVNGNYYTTDDSDICEIDGDYHLLEDCVYCERDNTYYLSEDCVYCEDDEEDVLSSEAIEIDGKWYHEESEKITKIDGEYYLIDSDEIECINGKYSLIEVVEETN